jgi:hypothetical protein
MEPMKRTAAGGTWDCLLGEIVSLITVKVAETLEDPLKDHHSLRLCNKAMKRAISSHAVANRFNLEHHYQSKVWGGGVPTCSTHTSKPSIGCKARTMEVPSLSRGWPTYAWADPMMRHSTHEQKMKETYKCPTVTPLVLL